MLALQAVSNGVSGAKWGLEMRGNEHRSKLPGRPVRPPTAAKTALNEVVCGAMMLAYERAGKWNEVRMPIPPGHFCMQVQRLSSLFLDSGADNHDYCKACRGCTVEKAGMKRSFSHTILTLFSDGTAVRGSDLHFWVAVLSRHEHLSVEAINYPTAKFGCCAA